MTTHDDVGPIDRDDEDDLEDRRLCFCGCWERAHMLTGECGVCGHCEKFTYDWEATLIAVVFDEDLT